MGLMGFSFMLEKELNRAATSPADKAWSDPGHMGGSGVDGKDRSTLPWGRAEVHILELAWGNELSAYRHCPRARQLLSSIRGHRLSGAARESAGTACWQLKTHQLPATVIHQTVLCVCMWHRKKSRMAMAWRYPPAIWSISCCISTL